MSLTLGIDIGGTKIAAATVDDAGQLSGLRSVPTPVAPAADVRSQPADKPKSKKGATPAPGFSN